MKTTGKKNIRLPSNLLLFAFLASFIFLAGCGGGGGSSSSPAPSGGGGTTPAPSSGGTCTAVAVALSDQVQNPVPLLPPKNDGKADNNGVLVELPGVSDSGAASASGDLVLGVGTEPDNTYAPSSVTVFPLDSYGDFITVLNGRTYTDSFTDTGSNGFFFPQVSRNNPPICSDYPSWYCPQTPFTNTATLEGSTGKPSLSATFTIENFDALTSGSNKVFPNIGGPNSTFDWGLPFYFNKNVFIGISGQSSNLGTGPYFASGLYNGSQQGAENLLQVSVSGPVPGLTPYNNEPLVSIKVCTPGTNSCQTIDGILLDTGSYGLRIFKQALSVSLTPETVQGGQLAECQQYADGTADWGPVELADVTLGGEPAVTVPVQVIDSTFTGSSKCQGTLDTSPSNDGYNGILGVGSFQQDCPACTDLKNQNQLTQWPYWSCTQ